MPYQWTYNAADRCHEYRVGHAMVTLEARPAYCDRGHWIGKVFGIDGIDSGDSFPRYYMDEARAKLEMSEWLHHRLKSEP